MGPGGFFPTNPDLAHILGFDFDNFHFFDLLDPKFTDFQVPRFTDSQTDAWAGPGPASAPLRDTSATPPDHKVGEIQGTRTIP